MYTVFRCGEKEKPANSVYQYTLCAIGADKELEKDRPRERETQEVIDEQRTI